MMLPIPASERWKPLRAGLVDMFYYDVEEFRFHDGRLLLRGNNGTGKSKVLALTLPFLLDGELAPHRVEPDGDRQKRMEWNLLLGGKHPHPERLGYTWLEFGRRMADGSMEFRTIGCGMKAVKDRGIVRHWFFVTGQRIGDGLELTSPAGVTLTREKLREAVEGRGLVYDRASDYRRAVDEALFGLGEHRYEALVNLLIQLRQPQLSKKPDERMLSRALTEALAPMSPTLIATVAEAFRGLDEERDTLRALEETGRAASDFLGHYRRYAQIAAKRKAAAPRLTHSRYEHLGRALHDAETRHTEAQAELEASQTRLTELTAARVRLEARGQALQQSPEMRDAVRIRQAGEEAERQVRHAHAREKDRDNLATEMTRRQKRVDVAEKQAGRATDDWNATREQADLAARRAGCERDHLEIASRWEEAPAVSQRDAESLATRRSQAVTELDRLLSAVDRTRSRFEAARAEVDRLTGETQAADERIAAAEASVERQATDLADAYLSYLSGVVELRIDDPDGLLAALESWAVTTGGRNPAASAVDDAARAATAELGREEARLNAELHERRQRITAVEEEMAQLEAGGHDAPPTPHTRPSGVRDGRPGAPLWKVVDFADAVPEGQRAALEAALEASGVLDAWVTPEGFLLTVDDTVLLTGPSVAGPALSAVLRPAVDRADPQASSLSDSAVTAVLSGVGLGPGAVTWVAADGRWANGVLGGSWTKPSAVHIGEGARKAARRARLAALAQELTRVRDDVARLSEALKVLAGRQSTLTAEHRALPSDVPLREAHVRLTTEHGRRRELDAGRADAVQTMTARQDEVAEAQERAAEFAGDLGLPSDRDGLAEVRDGVAGYRLALAGLWPAGRALLTARQAMQEATEELTLACDRHTEAAMVAAEAREHAEATVEAHQALVETAGAAVEELYRRLNEIRRALEERETAERATRDQERTALVKRGKAEGKRDALRDEIGEAERQRDAAVAEFRAFATTGLLAIALPTLEIPDLSTDWAATPAVLLARAVNAELDGVDDADGPWDRAQKRVTEEHKLLSDAMARHGHSVGLTLHEGVMIVDVLFQGHSRDIPGLAEALREETGQRARLLSAREREILENHLLNEVAGTLHELITAAEQEVRMMNAELESRPTSTGMRLRLLWKTVRNAPDGLEKVRERLRQTVDAWSAADREAVGAFLAEQIAREHAGNSSAGWHEQLTRALDYRAWHEFAIQRFQDGQWRSATGPASGGERVLAASVPLFAAASAHYKSAGNPHAPRLVALDEAFAGVDDDSRAKCLGLLATFDMDVVMTSEREWGCYPQVPGLAICQLSRRDGIDAVLVIPWRWDGHERRRTERPAPRPAPPPSADLEQDGLFS